MAKRETKAQRIAREAAEHEALLQDALSWPDRPKPEPYTDETIEQMVASLGYGSDHVVRAWTYNSYTKRVTHGCFGRISHSSEGGKANTKTRGGPWFSIAADAGLALEWAVCRRMAQEILELRSRRSGGVAPLPGEAIR